ncbi:MAG: hypothetical protein ACFB13_08815 [Kiloniellaceae bacterium]
MTERTAAGRNALPDTHPAALAALSISESLILTLLESWALDPQTVRRCLLAAAAGFARTDSTGGPQCVRRETSALIDGLLRQIEATAPSSPDRPDPPSKARP